MSLYITSLNSGSNGNCYYIGNEEEAILIDAGLSCKETETRMARLGLSMKKVKAIFISHEHSDHIKGVEVISRKYELPVYITHSTLKNSRLKIDPKNHRSFNAYEPEQMGGLSVMAFPKFHDAADPYSFMVSGNGVNVGVFTDIGMVCEDVRKNFNQCDAVFLETNYDEKMLEQGNYPFHLKRRIQSDTGHLSNNQALELFIKDRSASLSHIFLSHLSKDNNSPELVHQLFLQHAGNTEVIVASRYEETDVYSIHTGAPGDYAPVKERSIQENYQMKLFS
jgi:phosphoribosyl 1,2-cyclic phosphodiesterase